MIPEVWIEEGRARLNATLDRLLPSPSGPARTLAEAMRYAALGGGKRLRPLLTLAACEACGGRIDDALEAGAALEMIHAYSLIHDDLPAMDDDDLRRGRPTVHRAFDEASAILAGDALLSLAFEVLAAFPAGRERAGARSLAVLVAARAAGIGGMCGGQQADLEAEGRSLADVDVEWIHRHKTGALLGAAAEIGAIHAGAPASVCHALGRYGSAMGHAFQIADDILDQTSTAAALGKTPGKDLRAGKATDPSLHGIDASRRRAEALVAGALRELSDAGISHAVLEYLARHAVARES